MTARASPASSNAMALLTVLDRFQGTKTTAAQVSTSPASTTGETVSPLMDSTRFMCPGLQVSLLIKQEIVD